jgi:RNA polymerase sigma-70 factor (ECF subfamily)
MEENRPGDPRASARSVPAAIDVQRAREQLVGLLPQLRRFARALARNRAAADDLVQVATERALARSEHLRGQSRPLFWLLGIVRNVWIGAPPARRRRERSGAAEPAEIPEILVLQEALARLHEEQHLALALVLIEGLSYREAAELLNIPVATLTARLARARHTLQTLLDTTGARR